MSERILTIDDIMLNVDKRIHKRISNKLDDWVKRFIHHTVEEISSAPGGWKTRFTPEPDKPGVVREFKDLPDDVGRMPVEFGALKNSIEQDTISYEDLTFGIKSDLDYAWYIEHGTAGRMTEKRIGNRVIHKITKGVPAFRMFEYGHDRTIEEITPEIDEIIDSVIEDEFMEDLGIWIDKLIE